MYKTRDKVYVYIRDRGPQFEDIMRPLKTAGPIPPEHIEGLHQGTVQQRNLFWTLFAKQSVILPPLYVEGIHQGTVSQRHFAYTMYKKMTHEECSASRVGREDLPSLTEMAGLSLKNADY